MMLSNKEQQQIWDVVRVLCEIDKEKAKLILKVAIEKSLEQLKFSFPILSSLTFDKLNIADVNKLRLINDEIHQVHMQGNQERLYELLVDYMGQISHFIAGNPDQNQKKLIASLLSEGYGQRQAVEQELIYEQQTAYMEDTTYYTPNGAAKKMGISDQTVRRMCDNGKFPGAFRTYGGHWRIPQNAFATTKEQDKNADKVLGMIDRKNSLKGDVNEFDLY